MDKNKFKFIIKANKYPIIENNPILEYIEDKRLTRLLGEIYYDNKLISRGVIANFYKEFENINRNTKIKGDFNQYGKFIDIKTRAGQLIYEMKYYKNPPLNKVTREDYLNEISFALSQFINFFIWYDGIDILTYVPSSSKIPDDISHNISQRVNIPLKNIISKRNNKESKNLNIKEQTFNKYEIDFNEINKKDVFLVIDDVVGTGATFCEIMYKLNKFNGKVNYFLAIVKDVKR